MSSTYRPPYDEDDELDLRGLYRKLPRQEATAENDGRARRAWRDYRGPRSAGQSWHPGWSVAACLSMVAILFVWTDMREGVDEPERVVDPVNAPRMAADTQAPVAASTNVVLKPLTNAATGSTPAALIQLSPAQLAPTSQRTASAPATDAVPAQPTAASDTAATPETTASDQGAATTESTETAALSEEDIDARVAHIRQLMQDNQQEDARHALGELQQAAPDFTLPDDLEELAQKTPA